MRNSRTANRRVANKKSWLERNKKTIVATLISTIISIVITTILVVSLLLAVANTQASREQQVKEYGKVFVF